MISRWKNSFSGRFLSSPTKKTIPTTKGGVFIHPIAYLEHYAWQGSRLGLSRIKELLERLDNPQHALKFIHIAGTNGKGSTAAILASILQASGYQTGLFTSPYIQTFHERMQVNGQHVTDNDLAQLVKTIRPVAAMMEDHPTTFELVTAAAFLWFLQKKCDVVVLETGMGGALDATNVIEAPEICVITPIDMDHMEQLGETIEKIARTKAGIIKPGAPVVIGRQKLSALAVLEEVCVAQTSAAHLVDFSAISGTESSLFGQTFNFAGRNGLKLSLLGTHQLDNAAVALTVIDVLTQKGWVIPGDAIRHGLSHVTWPGRFELASQNPPIIFDGAHNAQGAQILAENLKGYCPGKKITFIIGTLADKDVDGLIAPLLPMADGFFTITPDNPRALDATLLAEKIQAKGMSATAYPNMQTALNAAQNHAGANGTLCVCGSLYNIGAAKTALNVIQST